ncbi:hypothetical protein O181_104692 [Austropuccinia psidii MF-1]|uniref:Uncharacterized protein n=1 Tax=Austropuccinia psidii MF-1 TaxID=1389203 RepID=A0A9Q3JNK8_9BASI|nr:hypothetical protein [Austropuccinia psidii MF-1]
MQKNAPPLSHSENHSDDVMVRTKPDSENHQNYLNDDETTIIPLDIMVRNKPNIENNEDNNTKTNHKKNSPKAKDDISMIQKKSFLTLAIQTQHITTSQPYQLTRNQPMPHG